MIITAANRRRSHTHTIDARWQHENRTSTTGWLNGSTVTITIWPLIHGRAGSGVFKLALHSSTFL